MLGSPLFCKTLFMAKSIPVLQKKRGRPATGQDPLLNFRAPLEMIERIDAWAAKQKDAPSRSEAIRRLLEKALAKK
ncbi:ribbon-helix-helix domain-containing protein [Methylocystis sp. SC2]|uniref:ribbon-helix-helix domain-containing protein n=1 Tax=Methylocystis sp. (strain SC2) TaxID=187303 RepID=UPI001FCACB0D|nr:ribbon-helix-helix domain-containing protein [Methylocystis sp. SC2]